MFFYLLHVFLIRTINEVPGLLQNFKHLFQLSIWSIKLDLHLGRSGTNFFFGGEWEAVRAESSHQFVSFNDCPQCRELGALDSLVTVTLRELGGLVECAYEWRL